jgi:hypothetical protein
LVGVGVGMNGMGLDLEGMFCSPFLALDDRPGLREQIVPREFALDEVQHVPRILDRFVVVHQSDLIRWLPQARSLFGADPITSRNQPGRRDDQHKPTMQDHEPVSPRVMANVSGTLVSGTLYEKSLAQCALHRIKSVGQRLASSPAATHSCC